MKTAPHEMFERTSIRPMTWHSTRRRGHSRQEVPVNNEKSASVDVSRCSYYQARLLPVNAPCADVMRRTRDHISFARLADYSLKWICREMRPIAFVDPGAFPVTDLANFPQEDFWPASKGAAALTQPRLPFRSSRQQRPVVAQSFDQAR
jgi:hypothetical protein